MEETKIQNLLNSINQNDITKADIDIINFLQKVNQSKNAPEPEELVITTKTENCKLSHILDIYRLKPIIKSLVEEKKTDLLLDMKIGDDYLNGTKKKKKKATEKKTKRDDNDDFFNQLTLVIKSRQEGKAVNVKMFMNGSITMTGCKYENDGIDVINNLYTVLNENCEFMKYVISRDEISKFCNINNKNTTIKEKRIIWNYFLNRDINKNVETIKFEDLGIFEHKVSMINSGFNCNFKIDRPKLYKLILQKYKLYSSYEPSSYQGVKINYFYNEYNDGLCHCENRCKYEKSSRKKNVCHLVTISVFQSGEIIVTGGKKMEQTMGAYNFIKEILKENYNEIVRFSILDI